MSEQERTARERLQNELRTRRITRRMTRVLSGIVLLQFGQRSGAHCM